MKAKLFAAALALTVAGGLTATAMADESDGPRASSDHTWSDAAYPGAVEPMAVPQAAAPAATPHYVWEQGYENGGKWRGHWELVP